MIGARSSRGMTLTELMVSVILVGLIMLGIASVDFATKQSQQTTTRSGLVAMQTGAMMLDIVKNVSMATGTFSNPGIRSSQVPTSHPCYAPLLDLCVRRDINSSGVNNNTPTDFSDDNWVCYRRVAINNSLYTCIRAGFGECLATDRYLGGSTSINVTIPIDPSTQIFYVSIALRNRYIPGNALDPFNNPEYYVETRVYPGYHSWIIP